MLTYNNQIRGSDKSINMTPSLVLSSDEQEMIKPIFIWANILNVGQILDVI